MSIEDARRAGIIRPGSEVPPPPPRNAAQIAGWAQRRDPASGLNQTEAAFLAEVLEPLRLAGVIIRIDVEPEGLRAGLPGSRSLYFPDFRIQWASGLIEFVEVKGHWLEDARVKIKAVAALHPYAIHAAQRPKRGAWTMETFGGHAWEHRLAAETDALADPAPPHGGHP